MSSRRPSAGAAVVAVALALGALVACGTNDDGGALGLPASGTAAPGTASTLTVQVTTSARTRQGSLTCSGEQGTGTGFLADPSVASLACKTLANPSATGRLTASTRPEGCPTSVTVPSTAHVAGTLRGVPVDTTIDRANPCDAASWDLLEPLLGPP